MIKKTKTLHISEVFWYAIFYKYWEKCMSSHSISFIFSCVLTKTWKNYFENTKLMQKKIFVFFCPFPFFSFRCNCMICIFHLKEGRKEGRKEGNGFFNDTLNTFYLWLYGIRHMVEDHSGSERGNPLLPHELLFPISSKGSFICTIPQTG